MRGRELAGGQRQIHKPIVRKPVRRIQNH